MDITQILANAQSADAATRQHAEAMIEQAKQNNLGGCLVTLSAELANEEKPPEGRRLAGIIVKNCLDSKVASKQDELTQAWLEMDLAMKQQIKVAVTSALASTAVQARQAAAQVVAKVAAIELPRGQWTDLIDALTANVTNSPSDLLKQAALETLGYICEEIEPEVLTVKSNQILTAVVQGMRKEEPNNDVRRAATVALNNALESVKSNFDNATERDYIMQTVCEGCVAESHTVRIAAYECIVKIATLYYHHLSAYMQALFQLTFEEIKTGRDEVAQQAVEFWSTVSDEEIQLQEEEEEARDTGESPDALSHHFVKGAMPYLVPLLLHTLTKQEEDQEEDAWNVAMAAGTCLALVAMAVKDSVVQHVMEFVQTNIQSTEWRFREASLLAFGSVLEGPSKAVLEPLVTQAVPVIVTLMRDTSVQVRDTAAWTIGRVCDLHAGTLSTIAPGMHTTYTHELLKPGGVLLEALRDEPRVACNVCWAIHNLAESLEVAEGAQSSQLSPYFLEMVRSLIQTTERADSAENNLRSSSFEALNTVLSQSATDTMANLREIVPYLCDKLERTFSMQIVSADDREEQNELQGLLCGTLQVVVQKLGSEVVAFADRLMQLFLEVFNSKNATVHEEALMAVGAVANGVARQFEKYMPHFRPFLILGLQNHEQHQVCSVAVGVIGDLCRALEASIFPYCDELVTLLMQNLQNPNLNRNVKPPMLSIFGDIALAISGNFEKYLAASMHMLAAAAQTKVDTGNYDMLDYLNQLQEGVLEAYTGILQGLREDSRGDLFLPFVEPVFHFLHAISITTERDDAVLRTAVGVVGDIAHTLGPKVAHMLQQESIKALVREARKSDNPATKQVATWAQTTVKAACGPGA
ncbi:hypothetical protein KFE25_002784 [Diacronema lutheri]|uniref:Importin N-terminal domain-containing protein n=2 Tax=Diacronema lutheri TaxID=2081491 RepID=A0A8J5XJG5_DIALT|nr:hypothetical protein KFE25_002784 [Diacronema lutheri]